MLDCVKILSKFNRDLITDSSLATWDREANKEVPRPGKLEMVDCQRMGGGSLTRRYKYFFVKDGLCSYFFYSSDFSAWSDTHGKSELTREQFGLPNNQWEWVKSTSDKNGWTIERHANTDAEGWSYGTSFTDDSFVAESKLKHIVRKRVWSRTCTRLVSYDED